MKHYSDFTLTEWLDYLEIKHQQEIQLELTRVKQVAKSLDLLAMKAKIITIAGTNGKGSTVAALEAIYTSAGYQVASFTSPHLVDFNERIRINQKPVSSEDLCKAFRVIEEGRAEIDLTYFEMATLAAFWHFKQHKLDLILLEVGLGGRFDATNIVDADLAIITTIDLDHQKYLGDNIDAIGYEKAGILRPNKPFIFADKNPPLTIVNKALELNTSAYFNGRDYNYRLVDGSLELDFLGELIKLPKPKLHTNSAIAAIISSLLMKDNLPVKLSHLEQGIKTAFIAGRLQVIQSRFTTLLDVSHNPQAARHLAQFIRSYYPKNAVHAVFSALNDKDIPGLIDALKDYVDYWLPALLTCKRAATKEQLTRAFSLYGLSPTCYNNPLLAYKAAEAAAKPGDLIVVYGSFNTLSAIIPHIEGDTSIGMGC
ncbi:MAG: bifunctional tetrahydrofolate synthase/dihydrofolate synthase [Tatlockia sp.]|nr:bifunctional tetrahydrofolate synthase/dihydrofolate synthase [Tatlockia sp.]